MFTIVKTPKDLLESENDLKNESIIACDLEADDLDTKTAKMQGIGYGTAEKPFFVPFPNGVSKEQLKEFLLRLFQKQIIFHNAKFDMKLLLHNDLPIPKNFHDTMLMSWLIDENSQHGLKALSKVIFDRDSKKWTDLNSTTDLFRTQENIMEELAEYCCADIKNTFDLFNYFYPQLEKEGVKIDYDRIELKIVRILIDMEMRGIKVDVSWLQKKRIDAEKELARIEKLILDKLDKFTPGAFRNTNIRSPKQIEYILFDVLKYPVVKETESKKRSTDNEVLEEIIKKNDLKATDIVPLILKFRDLDKVNGTYLIALAEQAGAENVIRANFMQHGTRTGRLSSNDPNMQNIPTRDDEWNVRSSFIAREGYKFLIADYSQIELRMLAHFSRDKHMVDTFLKGGDIHKKTMELTGIKVRRIAKNVNFGMVYGVGPRTLSHLIQTKEDEAKHYIDKFFAGYPQVKSFISSIQQQTFRIGYVEMITGRRRHFQEIADRRWYNMIARQAINTKIQGSAADLIKIAMIRLYPLLKKIDAHMLVQIHDEIIIETPIDKIEETKKIIKETMEHALILRVPLVVNIIEANKWVKE